ncbi:sensor histidine kinase [Nocardiopsis sp. HUAS JQ3]|uniref:sensor histidine kinase n=1 Tax=Nocardiopsis sp. HUAS JQ3 TaxID=3061629 RepID=UPI0023A9B89D|nr:sensor histidine kinase [Nocardiopsis sp. HUAS JQ3]WDZ90602.1 sensor histidine kinase [Nocardiopsis sp. HUAS JQ3]
MRDTATATGRGTTDVTVEQPGLARAPGSWLRECVWLLDLLVVLAVFVYNLPIFPAYVPDGPRLAALVIVLVGLCAPYLLRRRYPLAVLAVMLLAACVQVLLGTRLIPADVMLLFAAYNVATRFVWLISLPGAVAVVAWLLIAVLPRLGEDYIGVSELGSLVAVTALVWTWGTLVRIRRDYVASLQERARQLEREREAQAQIARVEERARIAREIHDIVSHSLSVIVLMSDGAASKVETEPQRAKTAMITARDTGRSALTEMRRMLGVLREDEPGSHSPQPGIAQLERLVEESKAAGLPVALRAEGDPAPLSAGLDLTVYRVVQEALTNVRKHAGPEVRNVQVRLRYRDTDLEVQITDDGQGFSDHPDSEPAGHGLVGMRERVAAYSGTLRAGMRPSGGFEVTAVLPIGGGP